MGNIVTSQGEILATEAVAKYMNLTKLQLLQVRDASIELSSNKTTMKRRTFQMAMEKSLIAKYPDEDILHHLFTLYDLAGTGRIPILEFVVGISPLACGGETLREVLRYAMMVMDKDEIGLVTAGDTITILRSINATASYFGDAVLGLRQIYKIVDSVFDTITLISQDSDEMPHDECIELLLQEPLIKQIGQGMHPGRRGVLKVSFSATAAARRQHERGEATAPRPQLREPMRSLATVGGGGMAASSYQLHTTQQRAAGAALHAISTALEDSEDNTTTDVSSVLLTPLARDMVNPPPGRHYSSFNSSFQKARRTLLSPRVAPQSDLSDKEQQQPSFTFRRPLIRKAV